MIQNTKNKMTISILDKLRQKGMPATTTESPFSGSVGEADSEDSSWEEMTPEIDPVTGKPVQKKKLVSSADL